MKTINLSKVISTCKLDLKDTAQQLFPNNKYPTLALNRVMAGKALLDADQISKLALMANCSIEQLYTGSDWKMKSKAHTHTFENKEYRAELDTQTWTTKIFHKGSLFHESIIHSGDTPISEYLQKLTSIIENHNLKSNEQN